MQTSDLPDQFVIRVPDDALSPNLPRGTEVIFERAGSAHPGECVLIEDGRHQRHLRRYVQGLDGTYTAQAINGAYVNLESVRDGLKILAVMAWRAERTI
jgi:hypothetical protein